MYTVFSRRTLILATALIALTVATWFTVIRPFDSKAGFDLRCERLGVFLNHPSRTTLGANDSIWFVSTPNVGIHEIDRNGDQKSFVQIADSRNGAIGVSSFRHLVCGDWGGMLTCWKGAEALPVWKIRAHDHAVCDLVVCSSKRRIITAGYDGDNDMGRGGTLQEWDLDTGENTREIIALNLTPEWLAVSGDGTVIACVCGSSEIHVWDGVDLFHHTQHAISRSTDSKRQPMIANCDVSSDGRFVAACGDDGIVIWDRENQNNVIKCPTHGAVVWRIRFDSRFGVVTGLLDDEIIVWQTVTGQLVRRLKRPDLRPVHMSRFDGNNEACIILKNSVERLTLQ